MSIFNTAESELFANYLPSGVAWEAKYIEDSNLNGLINGLGYEFHNMQEKINYLKRELNFLTTEDLIVEWESMYGIPNKYFTVEGKTLEQRRIQILISELMDGADSEPDWEYIAGLLGYNVLVRPAKDYPDLMEYTSIKDTIVVTFLDLVAPSEFTLIFPFVFGADTQKQLKMIFEVIKPATTEIVYNYYKGD